MGSHSYRRPAGIVPLLLSLGAIALASPCWAQNTAGKSAGGANSTLDENNTGAGPRGTAVGPSTQPGAPSSSMSAAQTGVPPRGTTVAPSTAPRSAHKPGQQQSD